MADKESVNWDSLSDEDFMNVLESVESNPPGDGSLDAPLEPEESEAAEPAAEDENIEDTDQDANTGSADETVDDDQEDIKEQEEATEANAQDTNEAGSEDQTDDSEDKTDEEETATNQKEINYKEEYQKILDEKQRYEDFYNRVTGEFVANGRKVKGFDDPEKIIQAQQMAAGYVDKMAAIKPYRPFLKTLKEKGILDNPEKFNFAMSLLDGDQEAIKKQLKESNIDPMEIDLDNINYQEKNQLPNNIELAFDDLLEDAQKNGVDKQVMSVISNDWDDRSVVELLNDPQSSSDLISHITSGAYELVNERMMQNRMTDVNGAYTSMPTIEQYRQAATELENEYMTYLQQKEEYDRYMALQAQGGQVPQNQPQQPQMHPYADDAQKQQYMEQAAQKKSEVNEARRKAASLSKKKRKTSRTKKVVDPLELDDNQFTEYLDSIIYK